MAGDRSSLDFDKIGANTADDVVSAAAGAKASKTVVAAVAPGAVLTPWRAQVQAITLSFMPGHEATWQQSASQRYHVR